MPGAGAFGGFDSSAGLRLRLLLLLARDVQSAVPSLRSSMVLRVPPPLGVRCALFSFFVGVGRVSSALIKLTCFLVGLHHRASPSGFAFGLRLRASPSGFAFGLRLRARPKPRLDSKPMGDARGRSWIPHKTPTTHRGRICRGKPPCGVLVRFLRYSWRSTSRRTSTTRPRGAGAGLWPTDPGASSGAYQAPPLALLALRLGTCSILRSAVAASSTVGGNNYLFSW